MAKTSINPMATIDTLMGDAVRRGVGQLSAEDDILNGRTVCIDGQDLVNFGSCSYLGLEKHPELINGIVDAAQRFGSQFSSSRSYISCGLYEQLESLLQQIFPGEVIVTGSTTLGHFAALPVLIEDGDALVLDQQVHASVQTAAQLLKPRGIPVSLLLHSRMDILRERLQKLTKQYQRVWYAIDGIYSMYGDMAPWAELKQLLDEFEQLHLYVDDAHGMSWAGKFGAGVAIDNMGLHPRMVLATSLNKAFASGGGALIFPNARWREKVRNCGGTLIFSGPVQPPMLGAAIASAQLHLNGDVERRQILLQQNITVLNDLLKNSSLPLVYESNSPIFFVAGGLPKVLYNLVHRMMGEGFFLNGSSFPAVPMRRGGMRFTATLNQNQDDLRNMVEALEFHHPLAVAEEDGCLDNLRRDFYLPQQKMSKKRHLNLSGQTPAQPAVVQKHIGGLQIQLHRSIDELDGEQWDALMAQRGNFDVSALQLMEQVFTSDQISDDRWQFYYIFIRDIDGSIVLATFFTVATVKDDIFASVEISRQIELLRQDAPAHLTSKCVGLGSLVTEGNHLFLDRQHGEWRGALKALLNVMTDVQVEQGATTLLLRDFPADEDSSFDAYLRQQGFIATPMLDAHCVQPISWRGSDDYLATLKKKARWKVRKDAVAMAEQYTVRFDNPTTEDELARCYELYRNVHGRKLELNTFALPRRWLDAMARHPQWQVMRLYLSDQIAENPDAEAVAVCYTYHCAGTSTALIVGIDYDYLESHKVYKQFLYRTVLRAGEIGAERLMLGYTASVAKRQFGAKASPMMAYVQLADHFNHEVMEQMSQDYQLSH